MLSWKTTRWLIGLAIVLCIMIGLAATVDASGSGSKPKSKSKTPSRQTTVADYYNQGMAAVQAKDYRKALGMFEKADQLKRNDPDTLNMLAYTNRKLGKLDQAFALYDQALKRRPRFPEAREYLGEAHIQAALQQIEILRSYGDEGKEALHELIEAFEAATAGLNNEEHETTESPSR